MSRGMAILWAVAVIAAGVPLGISGQRYWSARDRAGTELDRLRLASSRARELISLRAAAPAWMQRGRPPTGLTPRISAALSSCGLPASTVSSVSPEAESPVGESDMKACRSRVSVTLSGITLPQLGSFLGAWRTREPEWTVSSIDLSPQGGRDWRVSAGGGGGGDLPIRAVIGMETLFVEQGGGR